MGNQLFKEDFTGGYDGKSPASLLRSGWICGGKNVRRVGPAGGWVGRNGYSLNNTTALASASTIASLHTYTHPRNLDAHFIAQANSNLYDATNYPTAAGTTFGASIESTGVGTTPGFSDTIADWWLYADGTGKPLIWGGNYPYVIGFFSMTDTVAESDYSLKVSDGLSTTFGIINAGAAGHTTIIHVIAEERASGLALVLNGTLNSNAVAVTISAWRVGAVSGKLEWTGVSDTADGTIASAGKTLGQSGTISWTHSDSDVARMYGGIFGYVYRICLDAALSNKIYVSSAKCIQQCSYVTPKWDGEYLWVDGCKIYNGTLYKDVTGSVTNESQSQYAQLGGLTTSAAIYIKTAVPAFGFQFYVHEDYPNTESAKLDYCAVWSGDSWNPMEGSPFSVDIDKTSNGTSSFNRSGYFDASNMSPDPVYFSEHKIAFEGDLVPGYLYKLEVGGTLSSDVRVYAITYIPKTIDFGTYDGVVNFKDRAFLWGDSLYPDRLRYSAYRRPTVFVGKDSYYTPSIGKGEEIQRAVVFYDSLLVLSKNSCALINGDSPFNYTLQKIANTIGTVAPKTVVVAEVGAAGQDEGEQKTIAIWADGIGVFEFAGRYPNKISGPIDYLFDEGHSLYIGAANLLTMQAFDDPTRNEYHLVVIAGSSVGEYIYNYKYGIWYPPWVRALTVRCGVNVICTDGRKSVYAGTTGGFVCRLEQGVNDKSAANASVAIDHSVKTRAIAAVRQDADYPRSEATAIMYFTLRKLWAIVKAATGSITSKVFKDQASTGTTVTNPATMNMANSGYAISYPRIEPNTEACKTVQYEASSNTVDVQMEIYSVQYELEIRGLPYVN